MKQLHHTDFPQLRPEEEKRSRARHAEPASPKPKAYDKENHDAYTLGNSLKDMMDGVKEMKEQQHEKEGTAHPPKPPTVEKE